MRRRNTTQKQMVYDALSCLGHASTESLIEYIQEHNDGISLSTIYRNISVLLEEGKIRWVKISKQDVLETVKEEHTHFVCERCKEIYDVRIDLNAFTNQVKNQVMHQIKSCDIAFYGLCQKCKTKGERKDEVRM